MTEMVRIDKRGGNRVRHEVRPIPDDFAQQAKEKNRCQLVRHYRTSDKAVGRWMDESGVTPRRTVNRLVPDNWEQLCAIHTAAELTRLLVADIKVIKRWIAETEIEPVPFDRRTIKPSSATSPVPSGMTRRTCCGPNGGRCSGVTRRARPTRRAATGALAWLS